MVMHSVSRLSLLGNCLCASLFGISQTLIFIICLKSMEDSGGWSWGESSLIYNETA